MVEQINNFLYNTSMIAIRDDTLDNICEGAQLLTGGSGL